jgi:2-polyprenyl-3-methyl-5-hydroxy-6-metoxy-1,4-benzoquinol methylase
MSIGSAKSPSENVLGSSQDLHRKVDVIALPENMDYLDVMFPRVAFIVRKVCEHYKEGRVLDIGCGNGKISRFLGKLGVEILGIDIDENEIKKAAAAREYDNVQFACASVNAIADRMFSGILLVEVLEHIEEPLEFLKEVCRLCEDGGFLIITVPNGYSAKEILTATIHRFAKRSATLGKWVKRYRKNVRRDQVFNESQHVQWFTRKRIRSLIDEAGFVVVEESYFDIWSEFLWVCCPWISTSAFLKGIERRIAQYLPHYLLEDWAFLCRKRDQ